jgi:hypothetical protein
LPAGSRPRHCEGDPPPLHQQRFVSRPTSDPVCAAPTAVDHVNALVYATQLRRTPVAGFLAKGAARLALLSTQR